MTMCIVPHLQISMQLSGVTSFPSFCALNPDNLFVLAPNSTWNYTHWMSRLCSLDVDNLLKELNQTSFMNNLGNIVSFVSKLYIHVDNTLELIYIYSKISASYLFILFNQSSSLALQLDAIIKYLCVFFVVVLGRD